MKQTLLTLSVCALFSNGAFAQSLPDLNQASESATVLTNCGMDTVSNEGLSYLNSALKTKRVLNQLACNSDSGKQVKVRNKLAKLDVTLARAAYLPRISVSFSDSSTTGSQATAQNAWRESLDVQATLYDFGLRAANVRAAKSNEAASVLQGLSDLASVRLAIFNALSVYQAQLRYSRALESVKGLLEQSVKSMQARYEKGLASKLDVLRIEQLAQNNQSLLESSSLAVSSAAQDLASLASDSSWKDLSASDLHAYLSTLAIHDSADGSAGDTAPAVQALAQLKIASKENAKAVAASLLPVLGASYSVSDTKTDVSGTAFSNLSRSGSQELVALTLQIPLDTWVVADSAKAQARARVELAELQLKDATRQTKLQASVLSEEIERLSKLLNGGAVQSAVEQAKTLLDADLDRLRLGLVGPEVISQTQVGYLSALEREVLTSHELRSKQAQLAALFGRL